MPGRRMNLFIFAAVVSLILTSIGCNSKPSNPDRPSVVTASSYLQCAVREIRGENETVATLDLSSAGMCPGHFDLRPSQIERLQQCKMLVRFDFQTSLDSKILPVSKPDLKIAAIKIDGGLCEPESYLSACRQICRELSCAGIIDSTIAENRLSAIEKRMKEISGWAQQQMKQADLIGRPVLANSHQAKFCRRLGLMVVSTFSSADTAGIREIDSILSAGKKANVKLIVANAPQGRQMADALAKSLGAKVAMLNNFPEPAQGQNSFDALFIDNIRVLVRESR